MLDVSNVDMPLANTSAACSATCAWKNKLIDSIFCVVLHKLASKATLMKQAVYLFSVAYILLRILQPRIALGPFFTLSLSLTYPYVLHCALKNLRQNAKLACFYWSHHLSNLSRSSYFRPVLCWYCECSH